MAELTNWAVSHDFLYQFGGAERVTAALAEAVGASRAYFLAGERSILAQVGLPNPTRLMPRFIRAGNHRHFIVSYPALLSAHPRRQENILASSYAFSHHVRSEGKVVVYCHTPMRQIWSGLRQYAREMAPATSLAWRYGVALSLRAVDTMAANRAHAYIATSRVVRARIRAFYRTDAAIIPPPVDELFYSAAQSVRERQGDGDYFVWAGRVVEPYKNLGIVLEAFRRQPNRRLIVVGVGRDLRRLQARSPSNVTFAGQKSGAELAAIMAGARATIFPSVDDFGMVATESMAAGTPVLALARGGALDTVVEGVSGLFFHEATAVSICRALDEFDRVSWSTSELQSHAGRYRMSEFHAGVRRFLRAV